MINLFDDKEAFYTIFRYHWMPMVQDMNLADGVTINQFKTNVQYSTENNVTIIFNIDDNEAEIIEVTVTSGIDATTRKLYLRYIGMDTSLPNANGIVAERYFEPGIDLDPILPTIVPDLAASYFTKQNIENVLTKVKKKSLTGVQYNQKITYNVEYRHELVKQFRRLKAMIL